jgi:hypothetical protein
MASRILTWVLGGCGVGLISLAALLYFQPLQQSHGLTVEQANVVLQNVLPGSSHDVAFRMQNRTSRPLRVVGATYP